MNDYDKWEDKYLTEELERRGLSTAGWRDLLIFRLVKSDRANASTSNASAPVPDTAPATASAQAQRPAPAPVVDDDELTQAAVQLLAQPNLKGHPLYTELETLVQPNERLDPQGNERYERLVKDFEREQAKCQAKIQEYQNELRRNAAEHDAAMKDLVVKVGVENENERIAGAARQKRMQEIIVLLFQRLETNRTGDHFPGYGQYAAPRPYGIQKNGVTTDAGNHISGISATQHPSYNSFQSHQVEPQSSSLHNDVLGQEFSNPSNTAEDSHTKSSKFRTKLCRNWNYGDHCKHEDKPKGCRFLHHLPTRMAAIERRTQGLKTHWSRWFWDRQIEVDEEREQAKSGSLSKKPNQGDPSSSSRSNSTGNDVNTREELFKAQADCEAALKKHTGSGATAEQALGHGQNHDGSNAVHKHRPIWHNYDPEHISGANNTRVGTENLEPMSRVINNALQKDDENEYEPSLGLDGYDQHGNIALWKHAVPDFRSGLEDRPEAYYGHQKQLRRPSEPRRQDEPELQVYGENLEHDTKSKRHGRVEQAFQASGSKHQVSIEPAEAEDEARSEPRVHRKESERAKSKHHRKLEDHMDMDAAEQESEQLSETQQQRKSKHKKKRKHVDAENNDSTSKHKKKRKNVEAQDDGNSQDLERIGEAGSGGQIDLDKNSRDSEVVEDPGNLPSIPYSPALEHADNPSLAPSNSSLMPLRKQNASNHARSNLYSASLEQAVASIHSPSGASLPPVASHHTHSAIPKTSPSFLAERELQESASRYLNLPSISKVNLDLDGRAHMFIDKKFIPVNAQNLHHLQTVAGRHFTKDNIIADQNGFYFLVDTEDEHWLSLARIFYEKYDGDQFKQHWVISLQLRSLEF